MVAEGSTCIKFESGLHPEIKQDIGYHEIRQFTMSVNKCRIYDEDIMARFVHYKSLSEKKAKNQYHSKSYNASTDKGKHRASDEKKLSMGDTSTSIKCGELGHRANECKNKVLRYFKYGKPRQSISDCKNDGLTCYNCGEQGHILLIIRSQRRFSHYAK